jgi:hypothetical protein
LGFDTSGSLLLTAFVIAIWRTAREIRVRFATGSPSQRLQRTNAEIKENSRVGRSNVKSFLATAVRHKLVRQSERRKIGSAPGHAVERSPRLARFLRGLSQGTRAPSAVCQISSSGAYEMNHQRHFGSSSEAALREAAQIGTLIADLDRLVRILDCDVVAEEARVRASDHSDAAYPTLARTLAVRRDNLRATIATLEERLSRVVAIRPHQASSVTA